MASFARRNRPLEYEKFTPGQFDAGGHYTKADVFVHKKVESRQPPQLAKPPLYRQAAERMAKMPAKKKDKSLQHNLLVNHECA